MHDLKMTDGVPKNNGVWKMTDWKWEKHRPMGVAKGITGMNAP